MLNRLRDILVGQVHAKRAPPPTRLNKLRALAAFSPDALSSIAYANQEVYLGLVIAGAAGLAYSWPIALAIAGLLLVLAISYNQTIHAYSHGGGSYTVARANLGTIFGLVAASALLIDYLLNAAVSLTAGVAAIASAFPALWPYRVILSLFLLVVITLINLRGLRESGTVMAVPVYLFVLSYLGMIVFGLVRLSVEGPAALTEVPLRTLEPVTILLVLHAFSTGSTALTGIEAISNGVPAFEPPESRNASRTLIVMAVLMGILFLGTIGLTQAFAVVARPDETILSALTRSIFGNGVLYYLVQISTLLVLTVGANTSYAGFPRLAAILARDGFLPRQLSGVGDRQVFTNGIIFLSVIAGLLIVAFGGDTHALVALFAVGAFLAFTLSQAGMVVHWVRERGRGWLAKALANGAGALATSTTLIVVAVSKFLDGAWFTVLLIPVQVMLFLSIRRHYEQVRRELSLHGMPPSLRPVSAARVVIPISGVHRGIVGAVGFAQSISNHVTAVYVELEPGEGHHVREDWVTWWPDIPLVVIPSEHGSIVWPLLDFIDESDVQHNDGQLAVVVLPEFVVHRWWQGLLHNQSAWLIKAAMLYRRRHQNLERIIVDVPYHLRL